MLSLSNNLEAKENDTTMNYKLYLNRILYNVIFLSVFFCSQMNVDFWRMQLSARIKSHFVEHIPKQQNGVGGKGDSEEKLEKNKNIFSFYKCHEKRDIFPLKTFFV